MMATRDSRLRAEVACRFGKGRFVLHWKEERLVVGNGRYDEFASGLLDTPNAMEGKMEGAMKVSTGKGVHLQP